MRACRPPRLRTAPLFLKELGIQKDALLVGNIAALTDPQGSRYTLGSRRRVIGKVPSAVSSSWRGRVSDAIGARISELGLGGRVVLAGFRADVDCFWPSFAFSASPRTWRDWALASWMRWYSGDRSWPPTRAASRAVEDGLNGRIVPKQRPDLLADALVELSLIRSGARLMAAKLGGDTNGSSTTAAWSPRPCACMRS